MRLQKKESHCVLETTIWVFVVFSNHGQWEKKTTKKVARLLNEKPKQ